MNGLLVRMVPGFVLVAAAATVGVIAMRTIMRLREERVFAEAWNTYRRDDR